MGVATYLLLRKNSPMDQKEIREGLKGHFGISSVYTSNVPKILWKGRGVVRRMDGPGWVGYGLDPTAEDYEFLLSPDNPQESALRSQE